MKTIEQIYTPYNFSATRCYVHVVNIDKAGYFKIEHKLPSYIKHLEGIFISASGTFVPIPVLEVPGELPSTMLDGFISLNFNGESLKSFHSPVINSNKLEDCSQPFPFHETIKPNSYMQGYYIASEPTVAEDRQPGTISIYLHYKP